MSDEFDVVVIGAGPAGEVCSGRLGQAGLRVAIVESHLVGGECSFYGCMPSKALLRPAEVLGEARRIPGASRQWKAASTLTPFYAAGTRSSTISTTRGSSFGSRPAV